MYRHIENSTSVDKVAEFGPKLLLAELVFRSSVDSDEYYEIYCGGLLAVKER